MYILRKKILFIVPSMRGGGAERVMLTLLKHLPREHFDLSLALVENEGPYLKDIPSDISVYALNMKRVRYAIAKIIKLVNEQCPDVVFSTLGYLNLSLLMVRFLLPKKTRIIVRESNTVSSQLQFGDNKWLWKALYKSQYRKADMIICQSKFMARDLQDNFGVPSKKLTVIYNPVDMPKIIKYTSADSPFLKINSECNVIAVGRLEKQKAFHRIILKFPDLIKQKPEANLWLIGEGPLQGELENLCRQLKIEKKVHFTGFQDNPYAYMANADLFVLSSIYEGLPNVLLEAIACGCPVISLEHPGGTREIMELTGQSERFVSELNWDKWWFERPLPTVKQRLEQYFGLNQIIDNYKEILQNLI